METIRATADDQRLSRADLFSLHEHYESACKEQLAFCYQYLNFYIGLLSAILAATLTGLLYGKGGNSLAPALLLGPLLTVTLAILGYSTVRVFYVRYVEAWVSTINIESMLKLRYTEHLDVGTFVPLYKSQDGGFLPVIERRPIKTILLKAKQEQWSAEKVVQDIARIGDTLRNARYTFTAFACGAVFLSGFIILNVLLHP